MHQTENLDKLASECGIEINVGQRPIELAHAAALRSCSDETGIQKKPYYNRKLI
jgi:hypothetical protein